MNDNSINDMIDVTMEKIKSLVNADTVIGKIIKLDGGITIIPISKVSYGFASGGSEFSKKNDNAKGLFGGGSGAGVTISPIAFLTVNGDGTIKILHADPMPSTTDKIVDLIPEMIDKIRNIGKKSDKKDIDIK